jgi:hypothetical protein
MPETKKVKQWGGTLAGFVRANADFAAAPVRPHLEELVVLAQEAGLNSSLATLAGIYYKEKKKRKREKPFGNTEFQAEVTRVLNAEATGMLNPKRKRSRRRSRRNRTAPAVQPLAVQNGTAPEFDIVEYEDEIAEALRKLGAETDRIRSMLLTIKQIVEGASPEEPAQ